MAIRIYALAKQLKVDNKLLVDACKRLGIAGKGSALASLSDEEEAAVKAFFAGPTKGAVPAAPAPPAPVRETPAAHVGRPPVLKPSAPRPATHAAPSSPVGPAAVSAPAAISAQAASTAVAEPMAEPEAPPIPVEIEPPAPVAEESPAVEPEQVEAAALPSEVESAAAPPPVAPSATSPASAVRREDYIGPGGVPARKIPVLGKKPVRPLTARQRPTDEDRGQGPPVKERQPAIKLAPLPKPQMPVGKARPKEPEPQKPDIKLPLDAIRASKAGARPLAEQLRKQEKKRKAAAGKKPGAREEAPKTETPAETAETARDKARRGGRTATAAPPEEFASTLGGREQRQLKRKRAAADRRGKGGEEEEAAPRQARSLRRTGHTSTAAPRKNKIVLELPVTVKGFAEALGLPVAQVLRKGLELGMMLNMTANLDMEAAELLAEAMSVEVDFRQQVRLEDRLISQLEETPDAPESLEPRPPVVTFLGHVDHGKTSLLDRIIHINVAAGEKGGITQHIRAYRVETKNGPITFLDTPGHEAFTAMRARGAHCTDIAVLVVAADDGVMPQTEEAISHARAAGVPIVVALNKIDLPGVHPDRAMQQLAANELLPSEWGGETEVLRTSAVTGEGVDTLLETLLTVAELREYKANPDRAAMGICLESEVQPGRGVVAKVLVQNGTLRVGDVMVCGEAHGRIKAMYDTLNPYKKYKEAGPAMPVNLTGLDVAPAAGDRFYVLDDISAARQIAERRAAANRRQELAGVARSHVTLENLFDRLGERDEIQNLNIILRADTRGSIEAIRKELTKLAHPEVQIKVLQAMVGGITEADVTLADASDAVIIGFNVVPDEGARVLADRLGVQVRRYDIIYQVTDDLKASLEGMLKPEQREVELGRALVQRTFTISRVGTVAGCRVLAGSIQRDSRVRLIRDSRIVGDYPLESLKREKDDAREVREGFECGMKLAGFNDIKEGDLLEAYKIEQVGRTL